MDTLLSLLPLGVLMTVVAIPLALIARRLGLTPWWAALSFIPLGVIVTLYVLAFRRSAPKA